MLNVVAAPVDEATARVIAQQAMATSSSGERLRMAPSSDVSLIYTGQSLVQIGQAAYYIYGSDDSFVIVAGDDRVQGVLAIGDSPIDMDNIPCGLQYLLDMYVGQMDFLFEHPALTVEDLYPVLLAASPTRSGSVEPMLTEMWWQLEPYYNWCPEYNGEKCATGCVCTSLSMVFHHWKYADLTTAVPAYTTTSLGISLEELPATTFDWDNMLDCYEPGSYTDVQADAVAKLMRYVGQAVYMDYTPEGSGANENQIPKVVKKFGYSKSVTLLNKSSYTDQQWRDVMRAELLAGRPMVFIGCTQNGEGHAFNIDGYDADNGLFHVNFGWAGQGNAYCALNDFSAGTSTFSQNQSMVIGIQPPEMVQPELTVTPARLSFSAQTGKSATKTISVFAKGLTGNLTVQFDGNQEIYTIDRTTISGTEAATGAIINVRYNPTAVGVTAATVTISGDGVESQTVSLAGVAIAPPEPDDPPEPDGPPAITISVDELAFGACYNGYRESRSLEIVGQNLTEDITLSLSGDRSIDFTISGPTVITPEMARQGATVTVVSFPYSEGVYSNLYLVISCPELDDIKVPITGRGIKTGACLYPDQTALNFETMVGRPVTLQLAVTKTEFDGWLAGQRVDLDSLPDAVIIPPMVTSVIGSIEGDDCFQIKLTRRLTASDGRDSVVFTIAYYPLEEGVHNAQLTLSTMSLQHQAHPVTVELTGTAIALDYLPGDVDGDGVLTLNDVALLMQALTNRDAAVLELPVADVNGNDTVDLQDVIDLVDLLLYGNLTPL